MTPRVKEILRNYDGSSLGVLLNLARLLMNGILGGTGRLVIFPVDQGYEHGPTRSFGGDLLGCNSHFHLSIETGCNAYSAPLGFLEAGTAAFVGQIPLLKKKFYRVWQLGYCHE